MHQDVAVYETCAGGVVVQRARHQRLGKLVGRRIGIHEALMDKNWQI